MAGPETHNCPNCGAPLGIPQDHERYFTCSFCGTALEDQHHDPAGESTGIKITIAGGSTLNLGDLTAYSAPAVRAAKTGMRVVAVVVVASIVLPLGIGAFAILHAVGASKGSGGGSGGLGIYSFTAAKVIDSDNQSAPDLVTSANAKDGNHLLYVDFDAGKPLRWNVKVDRKDLGVFDQYLTTASLVLMNAGDAVMAFNRSTGALAWQAKLSDKVQSNSCPGCFQLFGDKADTVLTLAGDGTLEAWNVADGSSKWQKKLNQTPRQIVDFGGNPAVLDTDGTLTTVHVFNLADGSPAGTLPVSCPDTTFGDDARQAVGIDDYLAPIGQGPSGAFAWVSTDPTGACAQRWDPGHLAATWETPLPDGSNIPLDPTNVVVTKSTLSVAQEDQARTFDLATGALTTFTQADDSLLPVGAQNGVLVLKATSQRGTEKTTIEGVDLTTNNLKWTLNPTFGDPLEPSSFLFVTSDSWLATLTGKGLSFVQYDKNGKKLNLQLIDLGSGTATPNQIFDLTGHGFDDNPSFFGYINDGLVMAAYTDILILDPQSAQVVKHGP